MGYKSGVMGASRGWAAPNERLNSLVSRPCLTIVYYYTFAAPTRPEGNAITSKLGHVDITYKLIPVLSQRLQNEFRSLFGFSHWNLYAYNLRIFTALG